MLITGGSSGIGLAATSLFKARGYKVVSFSRREGVDITNQSAVSRAIEELIAREGRIDVLVNNAGIGAFGPAESASEESIRRQFEVNFFAAVSLTQKVLPIMRAQGDGRIINVASLAAIFPLPFQSYYSATKAALLNWSSALALEVAPLGVKVSVITPGDTKTGFTSARKIEANTLKAYEYIAMNALNRTSTTEQNGMAPEVIARAIVNLALAKNPPLVKVPRFGYALLDMFARLMPRTWVNKLIARFYI